MSIVRNLLKFNQAGENIKTVLASTAPTLCMWESQSRTRNRGRPNALSIILRYIMPTDYAPGEKNTANKCIGRSDWLNYFNIDLRSS